MDACRSVVRARARFTSLTFLAVLGAFVIASGADAQGDPSTPVAGAFVYPVGDEVDFTKPHSGEAAGFHVSDSYLVVRQRRKNQRVHLGVDLTDGRGGAPVRSIGSGVVVVADAHALVKVRKKQIVKVPTMVKGKRVVTTSTRWRTTWKWRTGWGNYVVVAHTLPSGETVHSLYGHLAPKSVIVKKGDVVAAGQPLGRVGRTGRATSAHLHLEIRKTLPASLEEVDEGLADAAEASVTDRTFALLQTVDPIAFLEQHVKRFEDLEPGTWEARYALAACRDGILSGDQESFNPDRPVTRADYYRALVIAFRLATPFTKESYASSVDALVDAGILDAAGERGKEAGDALNRSDALEILLRCLDKKPARGQNLSAIKSDQICRDFNRRFAGADAAALAEKQAVAAALRATATRRKAADADYERALKVSKAKGAGATAAGPRVKRKSVKPVAPDYRLDAGFEGLAQSKSVLTRAEACLLFASAYRMGVTQLSALERAAARVAAATSG